MDTKPTRNLALELVRVTEAAALAAGRMMGRGDKEKVDQSAVDAMREVLNSIEMDGVVVIGEGEKDKAPMLYNGETIGTGVPPRVDIAVDPIDGTRPLAHGLPNAISVVALAPRGTMFNPGPMVYMDKIAVGPDAVDAIDINAPVIANLQKVARTKGEKVEDLLVVILDRPRHEELIRQVRSCGARIALIQDGDVNGAIMTSWPESGIDLMMGVGGSPEAVITACALRAMGGNMQAKLWPRTPQEADLGRSLGYDLDKVLMLEDLVASDDVFFAATGVTHGDLLKGVDYYAHGGAYTQSMSMRGLTGTVRLIDSYHSLNKLKKISRIQYS
jgi:fructose-1,6-bisphosphatase II